MELKDKTIVELKALIFDELCKIEQIQHNITVLKQELTKKMADNKEQS